MFGIWCQVWGGVTGRRSAWLKANDEIQRFETREQAAAQATRLARERNANPHRTARFRYWVRRLPPRPPAGSQEGPYTGSGVTFIGAEAFRRK
jgi:hypothetical protein